MFLRKRRLTDAQNCLQLEYGDPIPNYAPASTARASLSIFVCWQAVAIDLMMMITGLSSTRSLMTIST